ncbi:14394_t:CDS:1, partial [Racocetra persica]
MFSPPMPLPLPDTSSLSLFKSPPSMTSRIHNDLLNIPSSTGFDEYDNLKSAEKSAERMDISTAPPSPVNCSVSIERRVNSADILRVRRNSDRSSLSFNTKKHTDWLKTILSRLQFVFLKRNDQKSDKIPEDDSINVSASSRSSTSVDTVRVVARDNSLVDHDKDVITPTLDVNKSEVNSNISLSQQNVCQQNTCQQDICQQDICDAVIPKSLDHHYEDSTLKVSSESSLFEVCAQTPRHFSKEPEVLGKVGRFTIVRESEDFNTTMFDQCHCHEKPCRFSANGGVHPVLPPEALPDLVPHHSQFHHSQFYPVNTYNSPPIRIPVHSNSVNLASYKLSSQQKYGTQLKHYSWDSVAPYRPGVSQSSSLYTHQSSAATSRSSLSPLKYSSDSTS